MIWHPCCCGLLLVGARIQGRRLFLMWSLAPPCIRWRRLSSVSMQILKVLREFPCSNCIRSPFLVVPATTRELRKGERGAILSLRPCIIIEAR
ncbi:hypothetical protein EV421DRAFT_1830772, partial [Armillaria borealis]